MWAAYVVNAGRWRNSCGRHKRLQSPGRQPKQLVAQLGRRVGEEIEEIGEIREIWEIREIVKIGRIPMIA